MGTDGLSSAVTTATRKIKVGGRQTAGSRWRPEGSVCAGRGRMNELWVISRTSAVLHEYLLSVLAVLCDFFFLAKIVM